MAGSRRTRPAPLADLPLSCALHEGSVPHTQIERVDRGILSTSDIAGHMGRAGHRDRGEFARAVL